MEQQQLDFKGYDLVATKPAPQAPETVPENVELMPSSGQDIMVFARTPEEMARAQNALISWVDGKIGAVYEEIALAEANLVAAQKAKIRTQAWRAQIKKHQRDLNYYEKVKEALVEGYFIVPDFPINVIGVRTNETVSCDMSRNRYRGSVHQQSHEELPVGHGEYVDPVPPEYSVEQVVKNNSGEEEIQKRWTAEDSLLKPMDFPFRVVKPHLLKDLQKAMGHKIFDMIGVLPNTRRRVDPMLVGVIESGKKRMMFLISWWIPTSAL